MPTLPFFATVAVYLAVLLVCSLPAVLMARRHPYHRDAGRKFLLAAVACGLICGLVAASSDRLVQQCRAEGNTQCFDAGATGMLTLIVVGFLLASVVKAYLIATE